MTANTLRISGWSVVQKEGWTKCILESPEEGTPSLSDQMQSPRTVGRTFTPVQGHLHISGRAIDIPRIIPDGINSPDSSSIIR